MSCASKEGCFTFTWEIENLDIFLRAEYGRMSSPAWKTETREGKADWWQVLVVNRGLSIEFKQICLNETWSPCTWKPTVITSCGKINKIDRFLNYEFPSSYFVNTDRFDNLKRSNNPLNYDTFQCKMLSNSMKSGGFRIHSVVKKVTFCWCREDPLRLIPISSPYFHAKIIEKDNMRINMILESEGTNDQYYICALALPIIEGCFSFVNCNVVWDWKATMEQNRSVTYNYLQTEYREKWMISEKSGATRYSSCKFNLQLNTIVAHHSNLYAITHPASSQIVETGGCSEAVNDPLNYLLRLYKEGILSDVTINTEGKSFSAHRSILAARSPVFRAMFEKDEMSEGRSGVVDIDDVDSETVDRMLLFLYGDSLQDLQWGEAAPLNYAANKYAVQPLKQKCADILKAGLTVDNVCDALDLAHAQSDEQLINSIVDFIYDHQEVVSSPDWQQLEESKHQLVVKITKKLFLKRVKK